MQGFHDNVEKGRGLVPVRLRLATLFSKAFAGFLDWLLRMLTVGAQIQNCFRGPLKSQVETSSSLANC